MGSMIARRPSTYRLRRLEIRYEITDQKQKAQACQDSCNKYRLVGNSSEVAKSYSGCNKAHCNRRQ